MANYKSLTTEADSKQGYDWFKQLYFLSPDPAWIIEGNRFVECNDAAFKALGYTSPRELLNLHPSKLSPSVQADGEDSFIKAESMMATALKNGLHRFEWIHTRADGSNFDVEVTLSSIAINDRQVIYCIWRDISERKQIEHKLDNERERIKSILNKVTEPIFVKDNKHRLVHANEAFYEMFGMEENFVIGKTLAEHVPENEREQFLAIDRLVLDTGVSDKREETLTLDGNTRTIISSKTRHVDKFGDRFLVGSINDITERKRAEEELEKSDALFRSMAETLPVAIYVSSGLDQICDYVNPSFTKFFGYTKEEVPSISKWWPLAYPDPDYQQSLVDEWQSKVKVAIDNESEIIPMEAVVTCKNGTTKSISWGFTTLGEKNYAFGLDLIERKEAERDQAIAATAFINAQEGMIVTDQDGGILKVNKAFSRITGYSSDEVIGRNPRFLQSGREDPKFYTEMWDVINSLGCWDGEIWNRRKNGKAYPEFLTITAVKDGLGKVSNYVATFSDISLSKASADEIKHLAFYDPLTRLPNRRLLLDRLHSAMARMDRSGKECSLLFLDLDNFKNLNDTLGHNVGDLLLQQVAGRLISSVRKCDTVARFGGDEFIVMLADLDKRSLVAVEQTNLIARKILDFLNQPYQLDTHVYKNSASIGITMVENADQSVNVLLKQADIAMYQSKNEGRNTIRFFDPVMQEKLNARTKLEDDLRQALDEQEFELYFQIQVNDENHTLGAEALIRWHHPRRQLLSPEEFIPQAETSGLIFPIGQWVLESACKTLQSWEQSVRTRDLVISVNVSAHQFRQPNFVEHIEALIGNYGVNPNRLKLELTETLILVDVEEAITRMNALKKIGVHLVLDDFGTGYSSLQYLKRLPLELIKIDKSFIQDIETDADDRAIVSTIIAMAKNLNVQVIAEGVETKAQEKFLRSRDCRQFQGYLFGKPVPVEQFVESLKG